MSDHFGTLRIKGLKFDDINSQCFDFTTMTSNHLVVAVIRRKLLYYCGCKQTLKIAIGNFFLKIMLNFPKRTSMKKFIFATFGDNSLQLIF